VTIAVARRCKRVDLLASRVDRPAIQPQAVRELQAVPTEITDRDVPKLPAAAGYGRSIRSGLVGVKDADVIGVEVPLRDMVRGHVTVGIAPKQPAVDPGPDPQIEPVGIRHQATLISVFGYCCVISAK